ncbi:hypothetical protein Dimus_020923, partial [Dionaea muscipula]
MPGHGGGKPDEDACLLREELTPIELSATIHETRPCKELGHPWSSAMHGLPLRCLDAINPGQGEWDLGLPTMSSASWPSPSARHI